MASCLAFLAQAQFAGGNGDGFDGKQHVDTTEGPRAFNGGQGDGIAAKSFTNSELAMGFQGGLGDGIAAGQHIEQGGPKYKGGEGDGFNASTIQTDADVNYKGGNGDGGDLTSHQTESQNDVYTGGGGDGTDLNKYLTKVWEGTVSRQWINGSNWSDLTVPTFEDNVYIPNDKPFYPRLAGETLFIGTIPFPTDPQALTLRIAGNASLNGIGNSQIHNYGLIILGGEINFSSSASTIIQNFEGSRFLVRNGALLSLVHSP